jgi:O-antigen ligase
MLDAPAHLRAPAGPGRPVLNARAALEHGSVAALLLWWAVPMTRNEGGRGPGSTAVALIIVAVALWANDALSRMGRTASNLIVAVPVAALVICLASPTGWYGADDAAAYTLGALTLAVIAGYANSAQRRRVVVSAVCAAGLVQFAEAFLPWWGGEDPSAPMIGTFYWWNPYAAFLLPGALLGVALAVHGHRPWRAIGWFAAPLCAAGIVFSSSRMTLSLLVVGYFGLLLLGLARSSRRGVLVRWVVVGVLTGGVVLGVSGPPVFPHRVSVLAAADAKSASGQTVAQNGAYRVQFWQRAVAVFEDRPLVGSGPHALVGASDGLVPAGLARSNLAHNGYLQVLSDGGLVLGLPFLLGCAGVLVAGLRLLLSARRQPAERWLRIALPVALLGSAAHSAVDFDWSHPSDLVLTALLAGLVLSFRPVTASRWRRLPAVLVTLLVPVFVVAAWHWDDTKLDIARVHASAAVRAHDLRETGSQPVRDYRWASAVLVEGAGASGPVSGHGVAPADLAWAVNRTAAVAPVAPDIQLLRARALVVLGRKAEAASLVDHVVTQMGRSGAGPVADQAAEVLAAVGRSDDARSLLAQFLVVGALDDHAGQHLNALLDVDRGRLTELDRCAYAAVRPDLRPTSASDPGAPAPGVSCDAVLRGVAR